MLFVNALISRQLLKQRRVVYMMNFIFVMR